MNILSEWIFIGKYQKVAWLDGRTGETAEADLRHEKEEEVKKFYQRFPPGSVIGMEAGGYSWWFERADGATGARAASGRSGTDCPQARAQTEE